MQNYGYYYDPHQWQQFYMDAAAAGHFHQQQLLLPSHHLPPTNQVIPLSQTPYFGFQAPVQVQHGNNCPCVNCGVRREYHMPYRPPRVVDDPKELAEIMFGERGLMPRATLVELDDEDDIPVRKRVPLKPRNAELRAALGSPKSKGSKRVESKLKENRQAENTTMPRRKYLDVTENDYRSSSSVYYQKALNQLMKDFPHLYKKDLRFILERNYNRYAPTYFKIWKILDRFMQKKSKSYVPKEDALIYDEEFQKELEYVRRREARKVEKKREKDLERFVRQLSLGE